NETLLLLAELRILARAHRAVVEGDSTRDGTGPPRARRRPASQRVLPRDESTGTGAGAGRRRPGIQPVARDHRIPGRNASRSAAAATGFPRPRDRAVDGPWGRLRHPSAAELARARLPARS